MVICITTVLTCAVSYGVVFRSLWRSRYSQGCSVCNSLLRNVTSLQLSFWCFGPVMRGIDLSFMDNLQLCGSFRLLMTFSTLMSIKSYLQYMSTFIWPAATMFTMWFRQSFLGQFANIEFLFFGYACVLLNMHLKYFSYNCSGFMSAM